MTDIHFYYADGRYGFLSNLYPCAVEFEGRTFRCAEEAYQFGKPRKREVAEWLVDSPELSLCALVAHALSPRHVCSDWSDIKVKRMYAVLRAKFQQHPDLCAQLLATGNCRLLEASRTDGFWGVGKKGTGKNLLGRLLRIVRRSFRAKVQSAPPRLTSSPLHGKNAVDTK